jgi:hypothetical protein
MKDLSETAPDDRMRRIARRAHEAGLSFPEFVEALGRTDRGSLLTTFKKPRHRPSTIRKYAQVYGLWDERQIAALLDELSNDDINMTLTEMVRILEVQSPYSVEQFQSIRTNLQELPDIERQKIVKEFLLEHKHCFSAYSTSHENVLIKKALNVERLAMFKRKYDAALRYCVIALASDIMPTPTTPNNYNAFFLTDAFRSILIDPNDTKPEILRLLSDLHQRGKIHDPQPLIEAINQEVFSANLSGTYEIGKHI